MKLTTYLLSFAACILAVSALPYPLRSEKLTGDNGTILPVRDVIVRHDDPLFARYFEGVYDISEREFLEGTIEPRVDAIAIAETVVKGVIKIVELIKGKIEADKYVSFSSFFAFF